MKGKIWAISSVVIVLIIGLGVLGMNLYNENVDEQISEGAKKEAIRFFKEEKNEEFVAKETEFNKQMGTIRVRGYFESDPDQKYYASLMYYKKDDGYTYDIGSHGKIYADTQEEFIEQQKEKNE